MNRIKIYAKLSQMMIQDVLVYRVDYIARFITFGARFLVSAYLWIAIIQAKGGEVAGYTLQSALTYFLLIQIVGAFAFSLAGFHVAHFIQSGDLSNRLVQPIDYLMSVFATNLGRSFFYFLGNLLICSAFGMVFFEYFDFHFVPWFIPLALLSLVIGFIINFAFTCMIGMLAFWITSSTRLIFLYYAIITFLAGTIIPLELFPQVMQDILVWTPFPYLFYYPVHILQSADWTFALTQGLGLQIAYGGLSVILMYAMYYLGLKHYEAIGK